MDPTLRPLSPPQEDSPAPPGEGGKSLQEQTHTGGGGGTHARSPHPQARALLPCAGTLGPAHWAPPLPQPSPSPGRGAVRIAGTKTHAPPVSTGDAAGSETGAHHGHASPASLPAPGRPPQRPPPQRGWGPGPSALQLHQPRALPAQQQPAHLRAADCAPQGPRRGVLMGAKAGPEEPCSAWPTSHPAGAPHPPGHWHSSKAQDSSPSLPGPGPPWATLP